MQTLKIRPVFGHCFFSRQIQLFQSVLFCLVLGLFSSTTGAENTESMINLNDADTETLQYIPGIGASKASSIVDLRQQRGGFKHIDELLEVRGIGEKLFEEIKRYGTLEGGVSKLTEEMIANPPGKSAAVNSEKSATTTTSS